MSKPAEILCIGHSHIVLGIDAERLETELNTKVAKYAVAGANTLDRMWMIKHYLSINPNIRTVIYDVDARLFDSEGLSSSSYTLFLPFIDDKVMSEYLWQETSWEEYWTCKVVKTARFRDQTLNIAMRGLIGRTESKKLTRVRIEDYRRYLEREEARGIHIASESLIHFRETLAYLSDLDIRLVLVFVPVIDLLNKIDQPNQVKAIQILKNAADEYKNITFLNYKEAYGNRHELFFDLRHLNEDGKQELTSRLIKDLRLLNDKADISCARYKEVHHANLAARPAHP